MNVNVNINEAMLNQHYSSMNSNIRKANNVNKSFKYLGNFKEGPSVKNNVSPRFGNNTSFNKPKVSPNPEGNLTRLTRVNFVYKN